MNAMKDVRFLCDPLPAGRLARVRRSLRMLVLGVVLGAGLGGLPAVAGPGAHGPNGEHLEAPPAAAGSGPAAPRIEAQSELFELVGTLAGGELSLLIDRFATNAPVLQAEVEVESDGVKAKARFHADAGDFVIDDPALIKKLSAPGEHALVITVLAGADNDLLDGVLRVLAPAPASDSAIAWTRWAAGLAVGGLALAGVAGVLWRRRRRASSFLPHRHGGLA